MTHVPECAWERTTLDACVYRQTHNYCPHPEHACTCPPQPGMRTIELNDDEARLLLEALSGLMARSGIPAEVTATFQLAQRLEGFTIDGRPGASHIATYARKDDDG
jgi:hypothetical protein